MTPDGPIILVPILAVVFGIPFVAAPIAKAMAKLLEARANALSGATPPQLAAIEQRMERLERGIEAISVELERVGEGQRFVTKLLAERGTPTVGSGER
ncbi:MAG: hypothetical protein K2X99_04250 [Gemmatimonadaceae bacterium]|nr:hypothetical protein [Gemmatimonadaceae bacterium]